MKAKLSVIAGKFDVLDMILIMHFKDLINVLAYFLSWTRVGVHNDARRLVYDMNSNGAVGLTTIREGKE